MTNDIECLAFGCIGALSTSITFLTFWEGGISVLGSAFVIGDVWVEQAFSKCNSKHERDMNQKIDFLILASLPPLIPPVSSTTTSLTSSASSVLLSRPFYQLKPLSLLESTP